MHGIYLFELCLFCTFCNGVICEKLNVKIGALLTSRRCCDFLSFEDKASAFNIAMDQLTADGYLDNETVSFTYYWDDSYTEADAAGDTIRYVYDKQVDVIFGSPHSLLTLASAHITAHNNLPHITWVSNSAELGNKTLFRTLVRTTGLLSQVGSLAVTLNKMFNWQRFGLLYARRDYCFYLLDGLKTAFAHNNMSFTHTNYYDQHAELTNELIDELLIELRDSTRIILLCEYEGVRPFMIRACHLGMCNGDYYFLYAWLLEPVNDEWRRGDEFDAIAKEAYKYMIHVTVGIWQGEAGRIQVEKFHKDVIARMSEPPWNSTEAQERNLPSGIYANYLYEAAYLYGLWVNHSLTYDIDYRNGTAWFEFTKNRSFNGMGGMCEIGTNGDKIPYFWIYQFLGEDRKATVIAESQDKNTKLHQIYDFVWPTSDGLPPRDTPKCGLFNELCQSPEVKDNSDMVIFVCVVVFLVLSGVLVIGYIIRRRKMEKELLQSIWRIDINEITMLQTKQGVGRIMNRKAHTSQIMSSSATLSTISDRKSHDSEVCISDGSLNVAMYKNQIVAIRSVPKRSFLADSELQDLKAMREIRHDNVNSFIGACFEPPSPCTLFLYCPKGNLQDILENDDINLDLNFKISLTMDLVHGMKYIHNTCLGSHGRLKSSNCLVDSRWMLKVTDYGVARFTNHEPTENNTDQQAAFKTKISAYLVSNFAKDMLWTAPELLVNPFRNPKGTKEGDVYSFSIILHEIIYRMGPFAGHGFLTYEDIISRVRRREQTAFRPLIFTEQHGMIQELIKLMQMCWNDNENKRPTFPNIAEYLIKHTQEGRSTNFIDVILQRLEKYATNLEELVKQRKKQLLHEKRKSDKLLYRLLPRSCAVKLRAGETVWPEIYDEATVYFSDVVGFSDITAVSTPREIVDLLNDLYSCFDEVIYNYDAYKVETVGDAYLVVSGVPSRNGHQHTGVIADMSLHIMNSINIFTIKHLPNAALNVRIGIHTGPCCAGIVGLSMPRYCLFGDTVNTASRMESNGEARRIHMSEASFLALQSLGAYETEFRGELSIKGKGLMRTYWLHSKRGELRMRKLSRRHQRKL